MSFGLPSLKVKPDHGKEIKTHEGPFGVPDPFVAGLGSSKLRTDVTHPLEVSERNFHINQEKMHMTILRNLQGLHAPLRLSMEMKFSEKIGRLPCLPSSNFQRDILTGRHLDLGFEDILNQPEFCEVAGQPHAVIERSLGLL